MSRKHLLVTAAVAALCAGILVLFTDIETSVIRWVNCGPIATEGERRSEVCR
ncbi:MULTISPECIES: hypothetical protein [unclassified Cyanobium]|uniref:hypothetical protein n=1 Tax=unclassified Cyanobium TaxID=2627006 RepID=UPI0020CED8DF|nr:MULTISPECIES: hypothetical protein [unclassified Cyanobium]MCP9833395.1 hypothetical protein [Cyanobium sp. La Preciosa 7G6]MCP9936160.1 hypothetical protein [Cyanobium sp. Aljojuca 7A6]